MRFLFLSFSCVFLCAVICIRVAAAIMPPPAEIAELENTEECIKIEAGWLSNQPASFGTFGKGPAVTVSNHCDGELRIIAFRHFASKKAPSVHATPTEATIIARDTQKTFAVYWNNYFDLQVVILSGVGERRVHIAGRMLRPGSPDSLRKRYVDYAAAANAGEQRAQFEMGVLAKRLKKTQESLAWFHRAAEQGHVEAQRNLGNIYLGGNVQNYAKALYWYEKASQAHDLHARCQLGLMHAEGLGVQKSDIRALEFWAIEKMEASNIVPDLEALLHNALAGDIAAQLRLGKTYRNSVCGRWVLSEGLDVYTRRWLGEAARQGNVSAMKEMAYAYNSPHRRDNIDVTQAYYWFLRAKAGGESVDTVLEEGFMSFLPQNTRARVERQIAEETAAENFKTENANP